MTSSRVKQPPDRPGARPEDEGRLLPAVFRGGHGQLDRAAAQIPGAKRARHARAPVHIDPAPVAPPQKSAARGALLLVREKIPRG